MRSLNSLTLRAHKFSDRSRLRMLKVMRVASLVPLHLKQLDISSFLLRPADLQRILHLLPSTLEDLSLRMNTDSAEDSRAIAAVLQNAGLVTKLLLLCASGARNEEAVCCLGTALSGLSTLQDLCCRSVEYKYRSSWERIAERSSAQKKHLQVQQLAMPCNLTYLVCGGSQDRCQQFDMPIPVKWQKSRHIPGKMACIPA